MADRYTIGIDLGGTNIKGGTLTREGRLCERRSVPTEAARGFDHVLARMTQLVHELMQQAGLTLDDVCGVGVGSPGPMSHAEGMIYSAPNLPGFENIPLGRRLSAQVNLPVTLENDANAAAFGEYTAGAGSAVRDMVMLTLGTGIGGGVVLDGQLRRGHWDNAGEIGHTIVVPDGRPCPCGQRGCLERYASANAVAERTVEALERGESSMLREAVAAGRRIDARDVLAARRGGDVLATRIWDETCQHLAISIVNLQHLLNPELVVLAGGLINAGDELLGPVRASFDEHSWRIAPDRPQIAFATLGTDAGTIGAAALAWQEFGRDT